MRGHNGCEELVAQPPSSIFQIPSAASRLATHICAVRHKIKTKVPSQMGDEQFVFVGGGTAKLMMEMQNKKLDSELCAQLREQTQKRHGICATRNSNADAIAGTDHRMSCDSF